MIRKVVFAPNAVDQLTELHDYMVSVATPKIATQFISSIIDACERLSNFPHLGVARDDVRPGLRLTHHKGRTVIAFKVDDHKISILGIFYGGQDFKAALKFFSYTDD